MDQQISEDQLNQWWANAFCLFSGRKVLSVSMIPWAKHQDMMIGKTSCIYALHLNTHPSINERVIRVHDSKLKLEYQIWYGKTNLENKYLHNYDSCTSTELQSSVIKIAIIKSPKLWTRVSSNQAKLWTRVSSTELFSRLITPWQIWTSTNVKWKIGMARVCKASLSVTKIVEHPNCSDHWRPARCNRLSRQSPHDPSHSNSHTIAKVHLNLPHQIVEHAQTKRPSQLPSRVCSADSAWHTRASKQIGGRELDQESLREFLGRLSWAQICPLDIPLAKAVGVTNRL